MLLVLTSLLVWQFVFSSWFKARLLEPLFTIKAARGAGGVLGDGDGDGGGGGGGGGGPLWRPGDPVDWEAPPVQINDMQLCPLIPPGLQGPFQPPLDVPPLRELSLQMAKPLALQPGGAWRPARCRARHRVAVVVPYRDRAAHLATLLTTLHPLLHRQQIDYRIVVVEQEGHGPFNRAMLLNVGYKEALKLYDFQCFIFHDVDLLPEDDRNMYICPEQPRHMSVAVDVFNYRLPYDAIFGGVSAMTTEQFLKVNGFSNSFWGWGAEDDDMRNRIIHYGLQLSRYPSKVARYKMLIHKKQQANRNRFRLLYSGSKRFSSDGLNSLRYIRKKLILYPLYTHVLVELDIPDFEKSIWLKS